MLGIYCLINDLYTACFKHSKNLNKNQIFRVLETSSRSFTKEKEGEQDDNEKIGKSFAHVERERQRNFLC